MALAASAALLVPSAAAADPAADALVAEVNALRAAGGAPALGVSTELTRSSRAWARRLARRGVLRHGGMREHRGRFRRLAEVLGRQRGRRASAAAAVARWLESPVHRAVLLDPRLRAIGVGRARGRRGTFWVARLGARAHTGARR